VLELYGGTELQAMTVITGTEWLAHRGSAGRPVIGEMQIRDFDGQPVPAGQEGEIWMRRGPGAPSPYQYIGATARSAPGGWESLGDIGYIDADGYVYITDRLADMILVGGANVYPAEIEAALDEHPSVRSCCVIGLPDEDLGNIPYAIVELVKPVSDEDLMAHLRLRLAPYKLPRVIERATTPLRDDAGKVRRSALRAERIASYPATQRTG
jgi:bile acid-coenzyme A ligase